jgi:uncharacterized membrane protein (DUF2068 family)
VTQEQRSLDERPIGVTVISMLALVWSVVAFFEAFTMFPSATVSSPVDQGLDTGPFGSVIGVGGLVGAVLYFLVAFGLWDRHRWAWWLAIAIAALHIAGNVAGYLVGGPTVAMAVAGSIAPAIILVYLLMPGARRTFSR